MSWIRYTILLSIAGALILLSVTLIATGEVFWASVPGGIAASVLASVLVLNVQTRFASEPPVPDPKLRRRTTYSIGSSGCRRTVEDFAIGVTLIAVAGGVFSLLVARDGDPPETGSRTTETFPATQTFPMTTETFPTTDSITTPGLGQTNLIDLEPVDSIGIVNVGQITNNNIEYDRALLLEIEGGPEEVQYNLAGQYERLTTRVVYDDLSDNDGGLNFSFLDENGRTLSTGSVSLGTFEDIEVPVTGVVRLTIRASRFGSCCGPRRLGLTDALLHFE